MLEAPHYPIVYVRGYAGSQGEVEDTVADPYMGFNLGATKIRQDWTQQIEKYVFESPLIRLMKDHGYSDVYRNGATIPTSETPPAKSIWIYRYYEPVSKDLGTGERPEMEDYARGLHDFIEQIRDHVCGPADADEDDAQAAREAFKVYLVAHSMGGLIVRCYLQNIAPELGITPPVDKVFTYATPHGGIDFRLVGNIPSFIQVNNTENFNEDRMRGYLKIDDDATPVTSLNGAFDERRFFCLVGTNHKDYTAASGMSRRMVGPMSDGLVQIKNAAVHRAPRAFVHRAHSGHYGIVNSEEGYQNLRRFLFGNVRVDGLLEIDEILLPHKVRRAKEAGKKIRASYYVEVIATVRGSFYHLHRRTVNEGSAFFCDYRKYVEGDRPLHLLSSFLLDMARVKKDRDSLGFGLDLRVLVPEYKVDGFLFLDDYFEGGYLFRDKFNLDLTLGAEDGQPRLRWGLDSHTPNRSARTADMTDDGDGRYTFRIPVVQDTNPGLRATLVLKAAPWE